MAVRGLLVWALLLPGVCWAFEDKEWIDYTKHLNVQAIFPDLEEQPFETWFQGFVGEQSQVNWRINKCEEQDRGSRARDFPICVGASTQLGPHSQLGVMILAGSYFQWISGEPQLYMIYLSEYGKIRGLDSLAEAKALLNDELNKE